MLSSIEMSIRSYGTRSHAHAHGFVQLVLPLSGSLDLDMEGRGARIDRTLAAYVPAGMRHAQESRQPNRFLVVDVPQQAVAEKEAQCLAVRRFLPVTQEAAHLIDYMAGMLSREDVAQRAMLWTPLLLDALAGAASQPVSRFGALLASLGSETTLGWSVADMAAHARLSTSRLHALFREQLDTTPYAWLAERRLEYVLRSLSAASLSIAEIAYRAGFADQSALTRAVRRATGMTPAAYRRQAAEAGRVSPDMSAGSKKQ